MEFILRPWLESDILSCQKYADNPKVGENLRDVFPVPYTLDDAEEYIKTCMDIGDDHRLCRAIEVDGEAVGSVGVFLLDDVYSKSAEVGYWLGEPFWGRGIMPRAVRLLCREAFSRFPLERIHAEVFAPNKKSCRALEKAGFRLEGIKRNSVFKNGVLMDSCVYALLKGETLSTDD